MAVLEEFMAKASGKGYDCQLLTPTEIAQKSKGVKTEDLLGGLWSATELTVDPREALDKLPAMLEEQYGVIFLFDTIIHAIEKNTLHANQQKYRAEKIFVCSGSDFETLYPEVFAQTAITKCKLQMMRSAPQPDAWQLGPTLCGGLTLRHYAAFRSCPSLQALSDRFDAENPAFAQWNIHVMMAQNGLGDWSLATPMNTARP